MTLRTDLITASLAASALLPLPDIGQLASCTLATSGVPAGVAARVLVLPLEPQGPT
jgi:hypothetical protein